jgi:hypothetical protein
LRKLKDELTKYKIDFMAIHEVRWIGSDILDSGEYTVFIAKMNNFCTGFVVHRDYRGSVLGFLPVNERVCTFIVKARFFNICFICVHAPTEEGEVGIFHVPRKNILTEEIIHYLMFVIDTVNLH